MRFSGHGTILVTEVGNVSFGGHGTILVTQVGNVSFGGHGTILLTQVDDVSFGDHGTILLTQVGNVSDYLCNKLELESALVRTDGRKQKRAPGCLHLITHVTGLHLLCYQEVYLKFLTDLKENSPIPLTAKFPTNFAMIKTKCLQVIPIF